MDDFEESSIGFHTLRVVRAENEADAVEVAKNLVAAEWKEGPYAEANTGGFPKLETDSVRRLSLFSYLFKRRPNKGYTFYVEE
ncbi:MAG: hypothetical protein IID51_12270 [Proteobacteria bacterium]|nr:hypothetical protein [Pseudomonadota bacterium]